MAKVHNIINEYKFTKDMLTDVQVGLIMWLVARSYNFHTQVLGQVDNKFIACILGSKGKGEMHSRFFVCTGDNFLRFPSPSFPFFCQDNKIFWFCLTSTQHMSGSGWRNSKMVLTERSFCYSKDTCTIRVI